MKRNKLVVQALVVTLMGLAAHVTRPAPAASATAPSSICAGSYCTGLCTYGGPTCDVGCGYICVMPPNVPCGSTWYVACLEPE